jgi:hypothetical protein
LAIPRGEGILRKYRFRSCHKSYHVDGYCHPTFTIFHTDRGGRLRRDLKPYYDELTGEQRTSKERNIWKSMNVMQNLIQQVQTLLQTAEDAERKLQERDDEIRILRAELLESKRMMEYWKKIASMHHHHHQQQQQQQQSSVPEDDVVDGIPKTIEENYGADTLDSKTWTSTLSISSNRSVIIQEIHDAIDELENLPSDLPEVLIMMDNILKVRKYYQYLWLEATCETTQKFGLWTKLRLQARNLQGDPVVAWYNGGRWAPREKEELKSFTALLVELQEEFETLCDD